MRAIKFLLYILMILVLQTVVFARLNFFGAVPDLVLVSAVILAIINPAWPAVLFAGLASFFQDILIFGPYLKTIYNVILISLIIIFRDSFIGDEKLICLGFVFVATLVLLSVEAFIYSISFWPAVKTIGLTLIYNLVITLLVYPLIKGLNDA